jgi:hypothetical protein
VVAGVREFRERKERDMDTKKPVKGFTVRSWGEIIDADSEVGVKIEEYDRKMDKAFVFSGRVLTINIRYPYEIELSRIPSYKSLLRWVLHLSEKVWFEGDYVNEFIKRVCKHKGWNLYANEEE